MIQPFFKNFSVVFFISFLFVMTNFEVYSSDNPLPEDRNQFGKRVMEASGETKHSTIKRRLVGYDNSDSNDLAANYVKSSSLEHHSRMPQVAVTSELEGSGGEMHSRESNACCIVLTIDARNIFSTISLLDTETIIGSKLTSRQRYIEEDTAFCVRNDIKKCKTLNKVPRFIAISTKGCVEKETVRKFYGHRPIPLAQNLQDEFKLPVFILNRFHAFSFGTYYSLQIPKEETFAAVNISSGVGYGVVRNGQVQQIYDAQKGAGGLQIVSQLSTNKKLSISEIASQRSIIYNAGGTGSLYKIFDLYNNSKERKRSVDQAIEDAADAMSYLLISLINQDNPATIALSMYNSERLRSEYEDSFLSLIKRRMNANGFNGVMPRFEIIHMDERNLQQLGVLRFAEQQMSETKRSTIFSTSSSSSPHLLVSNSTIQRRSIFPSLYSITGRPGIGKSTFAQNILTHLLSQSLSVAGIITKEIRSSLTTKRTGFEIQVLSNIHNSSSSTQAVYVDNDQSFELATLYPSKRNEHHYRQFRRTPYWVNQVSIEQQIVPLIRNLSQKVDIMLIDEIGGMQLMNPLFKKTITNLLDQNIPLIFTVPISGVDSLIEQIKNKAMSLNTFYMLTDEGRQSKYKSQFDSICAKILNIQNPLNIVEKVSEVRKILENSKDFDESSLQSSPLKKEEKAEEVMEPTSF